MPLDRDLEARFYFGGGEHRNDRTGFAGELEAELEINLFDGLAELVHFGEDGIDGGANLIQRLLEGVGGLLDLLARASCTLNACGGWLIHLDRDEVPTLTAE